MSKKRTSTDVLSAMPGATPQPGVIPSADNPTGWKKAQPRGLWETGMRVEDGGSSVMPRRMSGGVVEMEEISEKEEAARRLLEEERWLAMDKIAETQGVGRLVTLSQPQPLSPTGQQTPSEENLPEPGRQVSEGNRFGISCPTGVSNSGSEFFGQNSPGFNLEHKLQHPRISLRKAGLAVTSLGIPYSSIPRATRVEFEEKFEAQLSALLLSEEQNSLFRNLRRKFQATCGYEKAAGIICALLSVNVLLGMLSDEGDEQERGE